MLITISNRYGCGAVAVARRAAERLGYEYVDEQLPVVVANRLRTSLQAVESAEDVGKSMSERMLRVLQLGTPEVGSGPKGASFDEQCLHEVQKAVREVAVRGNAVLMGRGAGAILGRRNDIVRVFMHAPRDWRVHHITDNLGTDERTASAEIDRIDRARSEYIHVYYGLNWGDPGNYDLCLDTSTFGVEGSAALIVHAVAAQ